MSDHNLFRNYTMQELLEQLDLIGEMTKQQQSLYGYFGVEPST